MDRIALTPFLSVYRDDSRKLEIQDIADSKSDLKFLPLNGKSSFGYSTSNFWFKFTADNPSLEPVSWFLEYPYAVVDHFEFFHPETSGFTIYLGGDSHPFAARPVDYRTIVIPIPLPPGDHTFYFKISSKGSIVASVTAWGKTAFERHKTVDQALNLIYCGMMLATVIYGLFIFASMKQPVFLFLAFFVSGVTLFTMVHTGMAFQYLWPRAMKWANLCHPLSGILAISGALSFTRSFLYTRKNLPVFDRILKALILFTLILFMLAFFMPYSFTTRAMGLLSGVGVLAMIVTGFTLFFKQVRRARFYLLAWTPFIVSAFLLIIKSFGFLENNLFTDATVQISSALVVILLSFALMDNINAMRLEREKVLQKLHKSEQQYRMLAENVKDVIWILELKTMKLIYITPSVEDMMGYTPKEAEGFVFKEMLPNGAGKNAWRAIRDGMKKSMSLPGKSRHAFTIELECYNKSKEIFWTETTTTFIKDDGGNPVEMIGVSRDITERKNAEKEKQALEFQLNQSRKMEAIGTLAGGIAHDMNNIVGGILGYAQLSMDEADKESRLHHRLDRIIKACYRARNMVSQILTFSRQDARVLSTIELYSIVKEVLKLIRVSLPSNISIKEEIPDKNLMITADPTQVHQVVMNLCSNAGYAMEEKGGVLGISIQKKVIDKETAQKDLHLLPGNYVLLTVSDTGHGMTKEIMERIFEPFFTTKPLGCGTGMGLSMVHGIMEKLGGTVHVHSEPGQGSVFHLFFPGTDVKPVPENPAI